MQFPILQTGVVQNDTTVTYTWKKGDFDIENFAGLRCVCAPYMLYKAPSSYDYLSLAETWEKHPGVVLTGTFQTKGKGKGLNFLK